MKKFLLILTLLTLNILSVLAYTHLEMPLYLKDEYESNMTLTFGVDVKATNTWDSTLGELNAPRFPPPGGTFHAAFVIMDTLRLKELVWTYKDFRPIIDSLHYYVQYSINVNRGDGDLLIFEWNTLSQYIDSAKITDIEEDLDLVNFNMTGNKRRDTVRNRYINDYYVKVWYRNPDAGVIYDENDLNPEYTVYPVPAEGDKLYVKSKSAGFTFSIFSETGIELFSGKSINDTAELNIKSYSKGVYFVVFSSNGNRFVKKFIRF